MRACSTTCIAIFLSALCFAAPSSAAPGAEAEAAARKLLTDYVATWNRHDMEAFAQLFTLDCDYIVISGRHLKGRTEIFAYHDGLHRGLFKDRQLSATWKDFRFLNDEVAIGHVAWAAFGPSSDGRGNTTALGTIVLKKEDGLWLIDAVHNTLLSAEGGSVKPVGDK